MPEKFIKTRDRKKKVNDNIKDFFNQKEQEEKVVEESVQMYADMEKGKIFDKTEKRSEASLMKNKEIKDKLDVEEYNASLLYPKLFASAVFESIDLSEEDKISNAREIFKKAEEAFNECATNGILEVKGSPIFLNVFEYAREQVKGIENKFNGEQLISKVKEIYKANGLELGYLKEKVANKVAKAVMDERELTSVKESREAEGKFVEKNTSLLRYLHEQNIDKIVNDDDYRSALKNEEELINQTAFVEAIVDYAILEMLSTSKLIDANQKEISKNLNAYIANNQKK